MQRRLVRVYFGQHRMQGIRHGDEPLQFSAADLAVGGDDGKYIAEQSLRITQIRQRVLGVMQHFDQTGQVRFPAAAEAGRCRQVQAPTLAVMGNDALMNLLFFFRYFVDGVRQLAPRDLAAAMNNTTAGRLIYLVTQGFQRYPLFRQFTQAGQFIGKLWRIQGVQCLLKRAMLRNLVVKVAGLLCMARQRSPEIGAPITRFVLRARIALIQRTEGLFLCRRPGFGFSHHARDDFGLDRLDIVEHQPGAALIVRCRQVTLLGIGFAVCARWMGRPHLRRLRKTGFEDPVCIRRIARGLGYLTVAVVVQYSRDPFDHARLHGEQVMGNTPLLQFRIGEAERSAPCLIGGVQLVQGVYEFIAAGQRHRHQVRLKLHLSGKRALRKHNQPQQRVHQGANGPYDQRKQPANPCNPEINA